MISGAQVLVVKGALGAMGAGNTSVLMQLLVGMLDAALARRQDGLRAAERTAVALKIDEAPLVVNRGFAETLALKRSAGLETVACWQTDSQWVDRDVRAQLDALFAHRVYFATASVEDARRAASLMMAEFSDTVRPGIRNLSDLGRPDVRLHLPRHSALASWVTPEGRQAPFVAHTLPLPFDEQRLAFHAARQAERGGRFLEDLSQPHWLREEPEDELAPAPPSVQSRQTDGTTEAKSVPAKSAKSVGTGKVATGDSRPTESYSELVDLDAAHSVRWTKPATALLSVEPEPLDIEILTLICSMRHVLSSQIHRRFNPSRTATTTQRRLKRLADADLVARFQFHRRDGGGVPMCYTITSAGRRLVREQSASSPRESIEEVGVDGNKRASSNDERLLRQARHDVHVVAWVVALQQALPNRLMELRGPDQSTITPPSRSRQGEQTMLSLAELSLPGGRTPHDFLRTLDSGPGLRSSAFKRSVPMPPYTQATVASCSWSWTTASPKDPPPRSWSATTTSLPAGRSTCARYTRPAVNLPTVVFVCRDGSRARECARRADRILIACRAYPGEYPADWDYPGRGLVLYVAERDVHHGSLAAWGLPRLPPEVRVDGAGGDPRARDPAVELRELKL